MDRSPVVARRLGFASMPLAILAIIIGWQCLVMVVVNLGYEWSFSSSGSSGSGSVVGSGSASWTWVVPGTTLEEVWVGGWDALRELGFGGVGRMVWTYVVGDQISLESMARVGPWIALGVIAWVW